MKSLIFVLLATGAIAAPFISLEKERPPQCDTKFNRFHHLKEFPYNYEGETISRIAGASSARSGLKIRARCVVKSVAPCLHVLKLDTVELWEAQSKNPGPLKYHVSRGSTAFAVELEAQDLVFRTDRGRITEILAHPEEASHVLNIKRGILSALQVQFVDQRTTVEEDDVVGKCKVHYEIKSRHLSSRPKVIYKTRNLTECTDRAQTDIGIHVHSYEEKPISLLNSHSTCKLYLTAKTRTQKVVCEEEHIFRPFSAGYKNASGAITTTRQVLELQSIKPAEPEDVSIAGRRSVSLKYAHAQPQSNEEGIRDAFYLISRLSQETQKSTRPDSAQHFSGVVFGIRKLNTPAMETLWQKVHQEEDQKMNEYFYDALPHCGTGGCAKVMSHAIKNNLVSHERGNMFLAGLAMAANPTKETVEHVLELCEENPGRTAMLTLGTLIHKVCESSLQQCDSRDKENPITKAEYFLKSRLGVRCEGNTPEEFEDILMTLKAIGNAGRPVSAENILLKCAANLDAPVNMSIAALEALRRLPCNKQTTEQLLQIYGEYDLDVEIRIAAYLALMKCPSPEVFRRIADILKNEINNQVGSFVWSHMTNAMESTEPVHGLPQAEMMKDALSGMKLREFNLNRLRFSRAWEGSFYSDILRFGGSAQSHLIYHPTSFFPRSAMVNITVDVLGASINVLETAARFEGVEILIEQFFGDEGYFPDDRIMKMFNLKPHEDRDKEERTVKKALRGKRSLGLHEDINKVEKQLNILHRAMDNRKHHPSGSVSVKMFGNELRLASFDDISWLNDEIDKVNVIDFLLMLAKGGKKTFSKSMMFLDAQTTVPTILGLPLKLRAKGTTVASVELAGKFDIRNMFWGKMSFDVRGYVKPSAVVDISGRMEVSAVHAEAGILVNSSLYTVTQIKGNATYSQGELLKFEVGVPEDPVQFVNVSSSLFTTLNDEKLAIEGTPRRIEPSPCLNLTLLLGLKFCGQLSVPLAYRDLNAPFFPFSGPASYSISMQRTDPKLTKYQMIAERLQTEDENKYDIIAKMSTPGATWERNFDSNVTLWFKEDGKLFSLSTGALGTNFGTFEATYNNVTHALNLTYSAKDAIYGYPIILNGQLFNNTEENLSREIGIQLSASYRNYTIQQLTKLYNRSNVYGFVNNITYWPGKYLYSAGELNIPKKSIGFVANHTCTKTDISFKGNLGDEENNFVFTFNNEPTKAGIDLTGRHLKSQKEGVLRLFARPFQQSFTLRGSYAKSGNEEGIRFTGSHDNKNRVISWYTGIVNSTKEKSLKANATVLGSKAEAVWSLFNFTEEKGVKFNGLLLNKTIDTAWSYVNAGQEKSIRFNATGFNKTIDAAWTFLNLTTGKSAKFNASVVNRTIEAVWSYVNLGKEKGLLMTGLAMNYSIKSALVFQDFSDVKSIKLNASTLNRTVEAAWSYVNAGKEKGVRFNIIGLNRTAEVMWSYFNFGRQRGIHFNASAINRTMEATWTFLNLTNEKSVKFQARALNKTLDATWSILNSASEKSIKFNARTLDKIFDAKWTFLNLTNEKGLKFHACTQNASLDATWSILNSASGKSMKFNVSALNKTFDAKWSFLNFTNEKGLKFQASALNKTLGATWSFLNLGNEKSLRFNASALNKTFDSKWSFVSFANERSLKFDAHVLNKTVNASWSFIDLGNEKSLLFKANVLNKTVNATWIILNLEKEKSLLFKASFLNKTLETALTILNQRNEKGLKFMARAQNKTMDASWTFVNLTNEKSLKFRVTALSKCIESSWSFLNFPTEKGIKFNVSGLNKTMNAAWTFISFTNEKLIKFNATGFNNCSAEAVWSYLEGETERSIKFNASARNKTIEAVISYSRSEGESAIKVQTSAMNRTMGAVWSYLKSGNGRSVKFNASVMNNTVEAIWSYVMDENERALVFNASALNKTIGALWSFVKSDNERSLKLKVSAVNKTAQVILSYMMDEDDRAIVFIASAMNKTVKATWSYVKGDNEKSLKFKAAALNNTIEAKFSYLKSENEKALKFNALAMNKTLEAVWSYAENDNEKAIKFNASAVKKTVEAVLSYVKHEDAKSLQFKASAMNKSIEVTWTYLMSENGRSIKFNASAMNKTVKAVWSYSNTENGRSIEFKASAINKTVEAIWTLLNNDSKKGFQFNLAVMNKSMNSSLLYFTEPTNMGLRLNISCCNKSFGLETKVLYEQKQRKLVVSAAYQNYAVSLVGLFQNFEAQKRACLYSEYLGQSHGKICAIFTNSSAEKSMALNMSVLTQTAELKTEWFNNRVECANRLTAKFNRTTFLETWLSLFHTNELKSFNFNTTVASKSVSASLYFRNKTEKALGFNASVLNRQVGVEGFWFNGKTVKESAVLLFWNQTVVAKSALTFLNNTERQMVELRSHIGRFAAELQTTLITASEGVKELVMVRMVRNGSQSLFFDSSKLTMSKEESSRSLTYQYNVKLMGRSYDYGWFAGYHNYSIAEDSYHEATFSLVSSNSKMVSLSGVYRNNTEELLSSLTVEYLPDKTVTQSLTWFKQSNSVRVKLELVPKLPVTWVTSWRTEDGISIESSIEFLNKKIENWITYSRSTGEYNGHFEIFPAYPLTVRGLLMRDNGLLFTSEIGAFKRTWNHKIDFKNDEQKLHVSVDVLPNAPVGFDASWDTSEGMQVTLGLKGFKKSLQLVSSYDSLTKTFESGITVFQKAFSFTEKLDIETKTLHLTIATFNRTFGFIGRFDWNNYVASTFLSYQKHRVGWFLRFNPASRSIIFNITLTPRISGQVVSEMPDHHSLRVTFQRKFGADVINESRLIYLLNAEASRVSLTWNSSSVNTLAGRVQNLGALLRNVTMKYYNLTWKKAKNLTKELDSMVKKLEAKIRPQVLKLYAQVKNYNYSSLLQNATKMAQNLTRQLYNITLKAYNDTVKNLPKVMHNVTTLYKHIIANATELFKRVRLNVTEAYKQFFIEVLPPILDNLTLHLKNISRDLNVWASNVSIMVSTVTVRGQKLGDIARRLPRNVKEITAELVKKVELKTRELIAKIREVEIREQKIGPMFDKYMLKVNDFTCGFNVSCTVKNLTIVAKNLTMTVRNITVLNKTIGEHFKLLNETLQLHFQLLNTTLRKQLGKLHKKACLIHQTAVNFTKNLTRLLPQLMKNVTVQTIRLARNISKEVKTISIKVRKVTVRTYAKLLKTHRPLINLTAKVFNSLKGKAYPLVLKVLQPIIKFAAEVNSNLTRYLKPIVKPVMPMVLDIVYQLRNISVRHVAIGQAIDRAVVISLQYTSQALKSVNHTLSSNISAVITFIRENAQKSPEEIVDFTITKSIEFLNLTKKIYNQSLHFNLSGHASFMYNRSITAFNKTLQELLNLRPNEILNITIKKIQVIGKNVTAEILKVTKQLRDLDIIRPVKSAWAEMDLKSKIDALQLKQKWDYLVQIIRAFDINERVRLFKYHLGNATLKVQKELQALFNLSRRILNLTSHLVRMKISKEAFVEEFIAIGNETRRIFIKYGILAKNTTFKWQRRLLNVSFEKAAVYKNFTVNKAIEVYRLLKKYSQAFVSEHRDDALAVYTLYKDRAKETYEDLQEKAMERIQLYREKLTNKIKSLVAKLRQYENMTYEQIAIKAYEFSRRHGLELYNNVTLRAIQLYKNVTIRVVNLYKNVTIRGLEVYKNISLRAVRLYKNISLRAITLYKNVTIRAISFYKNISTRGIQLYRNVTLRALELFNDTKNATMMAYNFTLVMINRSKLLAIKYFNATRNLTFHYYNVTRNYTLQYYNLTRSLALQYYQTYYNLSGIYTLRMYNLSRNMTLRGFNMTRELILRGVRYLGYLNKTILPKIKESFLQGKVLVLRYVDKTVLFVKGSVYNANVWYHQNKEKTLEELYYEAYELAEGKSIEAKEILERKYYETKERVQQKLRGSLIEIKSKLNAKMEQWKMALKKVNNTLMNITGEAISLCNQTANITFIAAKELAAIFHPYVAFVHNKTVCYLIRAKNSTLPLLDKAMNISLLNLNETTRLVNETYLAFMAREDVQEFIHKHQLREHFAKAVKFVREKYNEVVEYVEQARPKLEAKIQTTLDYVNVTLPARIKERFILIKERYNMIQKKYERLISNPRVFMERVLKKVLRYLRKTTKETSVEKYLYQETWVELIEEAKGHQLVEVGRNITNLTSSNLRMAAALVSKNVKLLVEKIKSHTESLREEVKVKVQETRGKLLEKLEDLKTVKLREIVEHKYVFKTIELAKNITQRVQNVTLQARNLTQRMMAIGKVYYKNITAKVQNYTFLLKEKLNNYTKMLRQRVLNYTTVLNETLRNYTRILNETVQNYTNVAKAKLQNYTNFLNATVQNYTRVINAIVQNYTKILNASIHNYNKVLLGKVQNYTKMIKAQFRNYTLILKGHYDRIYDSHFLPLYRNGTILVHKYKAIAEHCISRCKNVTLKAINVGRNWTMAKFNLTRVWINQTVESGMKYYKDELKPLYYSKVLPFYNNTLVPMYHNCSKLVVTLRKNITLQAINMKERAISMTREAVKITLGSHPYAMLRKVGKMTIRESVLEGRKMYIQAFNYTLNMTRMIVNVTLTRFNCTKDFLQRMINKTMLAVNTTVLEAEPVIAFLNATREEVVQTAIFLSKYSGLEDAVRERVQRNIDIARNATRSLISERAPALFKLSVRKTLDLVNATIRYADRFANRSIVYLNATFVNAKRRLNLTIYNARVPISQTINKVIKVARVAFNKTVKIVQVARVAVNKTINKAHISIQKLRVVINDTIEKTRISLEKVRMAVNTTITGFRAAIPKFIQVREGGITLVIPHPRPFDGNIKTLAIALVERVKNLPQEALEKIEALKQELINKIRSLKRDVRNKIRSLKIKVQELKVQALHKIKSLKQEALEKMETFKREAVIKMKSLRSEALFKVESLKQNAIEKFGELKVKARKLTIRVRTIGKAWVAVAMNRSVLYRQKAYGFVMEAYNLTKNHPITGAYINVTLHYINITKDLAVFYRQNGYALVLNTYNLTKNHPLTRRYLNMTLHYFNITKRLAVEYYNETVRLAKKYYNLTKNHPAVVKCVNTTVRYFNITKKFVTGLNLTLIKNVTEKHLLRAIDMSRKYLDMTRIKNVTYRYLSHALNLSRRFVFFNQVRDIANKFLNMSRQCALFNQMRNVTYQFLNLTRRCTFLNQPKNVTMKYLYRALNLSRHCLNITDKYLTQALNLSRHWYRIGVKKTVNYSIQVYRLAENVTLDIYNSSSLAEAFDKTRNYSKMTFNITYKLYSSYSAIALNKTLGIYRNYSTVALTRTLRLYRNVLARARNLSALAVNKTIKLYRHIYNRTLVIVYNTTLVKHYLPMVKKYVPIALNTTRNFTVQAFRVVVNVTLDIYNSSCLGEAFGKTRNYSRIAVNVTMKFYRVALAQAKNFSAIALKKTVALYNNYSLIALNKTISIYQEALVQVKNLSAIVLNKTVALYKNYSTIALNKTMSLYRETLVKCKNVFPIAFNKFNRTIKFCRRLYRKTMAIVYKTTLVKKYFPLMQKYVPVVINTTRNFTLRAYKTMVNVTLDIYNSSCLMEAYNKTRYYSKIAFNTTFRLCKVLSIKARNYSTIAFNKTLAFCKNYHTIALNKTLQLYRDAVIKAKNYSSTALNKTLKFYQRVYNKTAIALFNCTMAKKYFPMMFNVSRQWFSLGYNTTRNFTIQMYKYAVNATLDIYQSKNLTQVVMKFRNYSLNVFNQTVRFCRELYRRVYNASLQRYNELCSKSLTLYRKIADHETIVKCISNARSYIDHTKRMVKSHARNLNRAKGHLQKRINHQVNQMSRLLNPVNWIPPFNSTAMIFGGPHVYTFDGTYYTFPGYKKPGCMYVLARDVRDNKFTILSQETAIIVVTEDASVKIHQDGRVETIVKVTSSGKKISDGYHTELPVETFNTTVSREGSFILLRHDLGLEIVCDAEHYLCTFNIARWYHGRMAGLLGTNNNEHHDEFMTSFNTLTKKLTDFVNSWEVTRDPECKILSTDEEIPKCKESSYVQRCRALFKDTKSPLHRYASVVNPEPFVKACELDYKECDTSTPKDMKHCNTTAAYIELVRLRGEYADYLPECGRCGNKEIGQRWFQRADRMVDVVVLVHETSVLKSYAEKLPTFLSSITEALDQSKYSFKFGVMAFGGRLLHARPHAITLDGQLMNDMDSLWSAFEHLKMAGEESENDTSDALEAMERAAYLYPFRPAATKIFLLLTSTERGAFVDAISVDSVSRLLETKDITLNVIGKYRKFRGEIVGQDYRGKVFYRKKPEIGTGVAPLPEGEYMALMKGTQGSVFGLPFLGSENKDKFGALQQASVSTWREQIKRDQFTCKECFCARGDAGQGKTICKVNSFHHQKC